MMLNRHDVIHLLRPTPERSKKRAASINIAASSQPESAFARSRSGIVWNGAAWFYARERSVTEDSQKQDSREGEPRAAPAGCAAGKPQAPQGASESARSARGASSRVPRFRRNCP